MSTFPQNEAERLTALRALALIGTAREPHFDAVCRTAQALFSVPITLVSLVEEHEQWFKAKCGLDVDGTSRAVSFCAHAILSDAVFVVEDASRDSRFADNPLVTGTPHIRFYAGASLLLRPGIRVGTLCLIDTKPRSFSAEEARQLQDLADIVVAHLRLHETLQASEALRAERESAEMALSTSEARYRLLAENTSDIIMQCDLDTTRRYVSPAARAVLGYAAEELVGTRPIEFIHHDDADGFRCVLDDLGRGRVDRAVTLQRYRHKEGHWVWIEASFTLTRQPETGRPLGYIASLRDVTDRKAAEAAAAESEARYREVLDAAHNAILAQLAEGVIVTDAAGRITLVNEAAAAIHGVARLDVAPDDYSATYHLYTEDGQLYDPQNLPLARAVRGETVRDARWRVRRPDGAEVLAIGNARPLFDRNGWQIGAVLTLRDDTAREGVERSLRAGEAALRELNATLSDRVSERTRDAEAAKSAAERASAAKTDFLAAMSHEIRTPLNAIIGFTDIIVRSGRLPPDLQHQAELVRTSGSALLTIVNDILDFSKVEAGAIELEQKSFASMSLIDSCLSIVKGAATEKGLELRRQIDPDLPPGLLGDAGRLQQILLNLLNNAIKFTKHGAVTLSVRCERITAARSRLRFSVIDSGIGIPAEKQNRLFQRFSQVDGSIQREFGGTGLGLAICKRLVELMDGEIGVSSKEGHGSTFWFSVSLPHVSLRNELAPAPAVSGARRTGSLLLVEDVEINQELARAVLESAGYRVDVVSDGAAAIIAVVENTYDLVLMDVQMPGMDGMTATRMIRRLKGASARVPIVAMTANVLPEQVRAFREAGMDDHVGKPFNRVDLYATLDRWLDGGTEPCIAAVAEPVFDRAVYDEAVRFLPSDRATEVLGLLVQEMTQSFAEPSRRSDDRSRLRFEAHALCSSTGMFGLTELSAICHALEMCTEDRVEQDAGEEFQRLLAHLRVQSEAAAQYLRSLIDDRQSTLTATTLRGA